ncbi:MAG: putative metal-binding motif-containing protein [Deltaproteobacteria bacterium]|nr:putative metal-binding motif-containing protein [Deltaproteobacteria bacterium]
MVRRLVPLFFSLSLVVFFSLSLVACGTKGAPDRFGGEDAFPIDDADVAEISGDVSIPDADPNLGGPCIDDAQCARPEIPCASFACDPSVKRCRATPDDTRCDDGLYCNGAERCDPRRGCIPGPVVDCSSGDPCMIDRCIEDTRTCASAPRDADGDGDGTKACIAKGFDCDDSDPTVSSKAKEICGNKKDDDCDGTTDEADCVTPAYGSCDTALVVDKPGTYGVNLAGTVRKIPASCAPPTEYPRQIVVAVKITGTEARDVDVVATPLGARVALASSKLCADGTTETGCAAQPPTASSIRLKMRNLEPGTWPLYLFGAGEGNVELKIGYGPPTPPATNLSCATALPLLDDTKPSAVVSAELVEVGKLASACDGAVGPLVYRVDIPAGFGPRDLRVRATPGSAGVRTIVGVRDAGCVGSSNELKCGTANPADLFVRALPAGTYYVSVAATAPTDVTIDAALSPATVAPANEVCTGAPALPLQATTIVDLAAHADDIAASCIASPGYYPIALDAAYSLKLEAASDVLLVARPTGSDYVGLGMTSAACVSAELGCGRGYPTRLNRRAVPAGDYRVFVESLLWANPTISAFVRPTVTPGPIGADRCADAAVTIPAEGGLFVGSTAGKGADLDASCDTVGMPKGGAPEVIYRLDVAKKSRLIVDAFGSAFTTTVSVRKGDTCPGVELENGCAAGYVVDNAFLDLNVDPGTYWIVVDGYSLASGSYRLDVRVAPPVPPMP